ncbi:hypothetical protein [Mucilaginibacter sp. 3215]|uniref:hypothetical protein n=1 Tax=Mucilaginibacter sp. 3215 TaxID=3373912 RepID=UPI003D2119E7
MKNNRIPFLSTIVAFFLLSFTSHDTCRNLTQVNGDDIQKVIEIDIKENPLTAGMSIYSSDVLNDTLYTVNRGSFLAISLKSGKIYKNLKISKFLDEKVKLRKYVNNIKVRPDGYYLSCINDLYFFNRSGTMKKISDNNGDLILDFNVIGEKIIIASRGDKIKLINKDGNPVSSVSLEMADDGHVPSYDGLCYDSGDNIYQLSINKTNKIVTTKYAEPALPKEIKSVTLAFNSDKYFIGFSYRQRNSLFVISKGITRSPVVKQISLGQNYFDKKELPDEGMPNFKIVNNNGVNYLILIYNKKLIVFVFKL